MKRANPYGHPDVLCVKVSRFGKFNQRGIQNSSRRTKLARDLIGHRLAEQLWLRSAGGICLTIYGSSVGWLRGLFARQPLRGRPRMWIAIVLFNVLRFATIYYSKTTPEWALIWLLTGVS